MNPTPFFPVLPTGSAFGEHAAQTNPDGDATTYTFNLRYPGQYLDTVACWPRRVNATAP